MWSTAHVFVSQSPIEEFTFDETRPSQNLREPCSFYLLDLWSDLCCVKEKWMNNNFSQDSFLYLVRNNEIYRKPGKNKSNNCTSIIYTTIYGENNILLEFCRNLGSRWWSFHSRRLNKIKEEQRNRKRFSAGQWCLIVWILENKS